MMRGLLLFVILLLAQLGHVVASIWMLAAILTGSNRAWEISLGWDHLLNALTGGKPGEKVSSRANRARREGRRWGCVLCKWLERVDPVPGHCERAEADYLRGRE
jgi:hypothetical protein